MPKKVEVIGNKIADQLALNTLNKLQGPDILKKAKKDNTVAEPKNDLPPITDEDMQKNADAAAARGAALLDKRKPGWAMKADTVLSDTDPDTDTSNFLVQLGIAPRPTAQNKGAEIDAFAALQPGEERFVSALLKRGALAMDREKAMKAVMLGVWMARLVGMPVARQERSENAHTELGEIDFAYYGFITEFAVVGLGQRGGYPPTTQDIGRLGFCIEKAGRALAAAWNAEIAKRK